MLTDEALRLATDFIASHEGWRAEPYDDGFGTWTIGYGFTIWRGKRVTAQTAPITEEEGKAFLASLVRGVMVAVDQLVTVPVTPGQEAAMTSFAYNLGTAVLKRSDLLAHLNAGDVAGAAECFVEYDHAGGREVDGLKRRRLEEKALFLGAATPPQDPPSEADRLMQAELDGLAASQDSAQPATPEDRP